MLVGGRGHSVSWNNWWTLLKMIQRDFPLKLSPFNNFTWHHQNVTLNIFRCNIMWSGFCRIWEEFGKRSFLNIRIHHLVEMHWWVAGLLFWIVSSSLSLTCFRPKWRKGLRTGQYKYEPCTTMHAGREWSSIVLSSCQPLHAIPSECLPWWVLGATWNAWGVVRVPCNIFEACKFLKGILKHPSNHWYALMWWVDGLDILVNFVVATV